MALETLSPNHAAVGKSISFRPASLYEDAVTFGEQNAAKPNGTLLNPSEVVCIALRRLFDSEGFEGATTPKDERARYLAKVLAATDKDPDLAKELYDRLCKSTRRRVGKAP